MEPFLFIANELTLNTIFMKLHWKIIIGITLGLCYAIFISSQSDRFQDLNANQSFDLKDDACLLNLSKKTSLIVTTDSLVEGVHFLRNSPAKLIGQRLSGTYPSQT